MFRVERRRVKRGDRKGQQDLIISRKEDGRWRQAHFRDVTTEEIEALELSIGGGFNPPKTVISIDDVPEEMPE